MHENDRTGGREERLALARSLVEAIERGDADHERALAERIGGDLYGAIRAELAHLTDEIQRVLGKARAADNASRLARTELPKAHLRLRQVLEMTEEAANQTLAAVEESLPVATRLAASAGDLSKRWPPGRTMAQGFKLELRGYLQQAAADAALLRSRLSDVLVAQGFQDLTGQIVHPVIRLVAELEAHLADVGSDAAGAHAGGGHEHRADRDDRNDPGDRDDHKGNGPAVRGVQSAESVSGQADVDDLLSRFGV